MGLALSLGAVGEYAPLVTYMVEAKEIGRDSRGKIVTDAGLLASEQMGHCGWSMALDVRCRDWPFLFPSLAFKGTRPVTSHAGSERQRIDRSLSWRRHAPVLLHYILSTTRYRVPGTNASSNLCRTTAATTGTTTTATRTTTTTGLSRVNPYPLPPAATKAAHLAHHTDEINRQRTPGLAAKTPYCPLQIALETP